MSRPPDPREGYLPEQQGDPMSDPPPPFDTESRVEHTDVDIRRLEELGHGQTLRPGGRRQSAEEDGRDREGDGGAADGGAAKERAARGGGPGGEVPRQAMLPPTRARAEADLQPSAGKGPRAGPRGPLLAPSRRRILRCESVPPGSMPAAHRGGSCSMRARGGR